MNAISTLIVLFLIAVAGVALIPVLTVGLVVLTVGGVFFIWLLPILIIAASDETTGGEKAAWILAIIFLSWFAWIFYFLLAPLKPRRRRYLEY
jgi:predicted membrane channel-forming protein YqfA (hemolysin III family)